MFNIKGLRCLRSAPISNLSLLFGRSTNRCQTNVRNDKTPEQKEADARKAAKKKELHISLIQQDKTIVRTTLEDATKLSIRRNLKLVKITDFDTKRNSPVYQMLTAAQFREDNLNLKKSKKGDEKKGAFKGEKLLALTAKIGDHDLQSKLNKMLSWLQRNYEIRVSISAATSEDTAEGLFKKIETFISTQGRILQKRTSGNDIKFQVIPPKKMASSNEDEKKTTE